MNKRERARQRLKERYQDLYKPQFPERKFLCFYCGEPADCLDHVPPMSYVADWGTDVLSECGVRFVLVESCRECNVLLGASECSTPLDRQEEIKGLLAKRHRNVLCLPEWHEDEMDELGPVLRGYVGKPNDAQKWIKRRLDWTAADYLFAIPSKDSL